MANETEKELNVIDIPTIPFTESIRLLGTNDDGKSGQVTGAAIVSDMTTILENNGPLKEMVASAAESQTKAEEARIITEAARDSTLANVGTYPTEALGRAAVADGEYFDVEGAGDVAAYRYLRISSSSSVLKTSLPSKAKTDKISGKVDLISARVLGTTKQSAQLINKAEIVSGTYYSTTGTIQTSANWRRTANLIPVKPGTTYRIKGISSTYVATGYSDNSAIAANFTEQIGTNTGIKTTLDFVTGPNTYFIGVNIDSSTSPNSTNTVFLFEYTGADKTIEDFDVRVNSDAIKDPIAGVIYQDVFNLNKAKVDAITYQSPNLIVISDLVAGSAFSNSSGNIGASAGGKRTGYIPVLPNTAMYLQGIGAGFPGNIYDANLVRLRKIAEPAPTGEFYTFVAFNTGADAAYIGINISSREATLPGIYDETAMVSVGSAARPYEVGGVTVPYTRVSKAPVFGPAYFSYTHSLLQFTIYAQYPNKPSMYFGFNVKKITDTNIRADMWRVAGGQLYSFNGTTMTSQSKTMLLSLENEYVYKQAGKADHTGGYHGDEMMDEVMFFVDGVLIATPSADLALTACNTFHYRQKSRMFEMENVPPQPGVVQAEHVKITSFERGEYLTRNVLKWSSALPSTGITLDDGYVGLFCVGSSQAAKMYTRRSMNVVTAAGNDAYYFNETNGSDEIFYFNETEKLAGRVSSKINAVVENGLDKTQDYVAAANTSCWDRATDRKYYRRFAGKKAYPGDVWDMQLKFNFSAM